MDMMSLILSHPIIKLVIAKLRSACEYVGLKPTCDSKTDEYILIMILVGLAVGIFSMISTSYGLKKVSQTIEDTVNAEEVEPPKPPRDFTIHQLREFDGKDDKPIYIALRGEVYDVSKAHDMYGPGSGYNCFAGRDASRAMAKLSFEESELSNPKVDDLNAFERDTLDDWIEKYKHYKGYPIVGRVSTPPAIKNFTRAELAPYTGTQPVPEGRVDAPIYVGLAGKVIDVSYGGKEMYGEEGPYHIFAGIDASRALGKMSFDKADLDNYDVSDFSEEQLKTMNDWAERLSKKYPVVGNIVD